MPRKIKQKQKQSQRQTTKVIVNVGTRRRVRRQKKDSQERRPPPPPSFLPYPVPTLRGPEPYVQPQPSLVRPEESLVQQLEKLKALHHLIAPKPVSIPTPAPAPIKKIIAEEKEEAGSPVVIQPNEAMVTPDEPIVSAKPDISPGERLKIKRPQLAPQSSSASSTLEDKYLYRTNQTRAELDKMPYKRKDEKPGLPSIETYAQAVGVPLGRMITTKAQAIAAILEAYPPLSPQL